MDILICNGKLTCNKSSQLSFNVLFRILFQYAYTLKIVNLPSTVLSWCAVTPKWCFDLPGRLKRKLMKCRLHGKRFWKIKKLNDTWTRQWELACEHHTQKHTRACTHTDTHAGAGMYTEDCSRGTVRKPLELRPVSGSITYWRAQPVPESWSWPSAQQPLFIPSTVCRGSQLVLHDQDLILFFQQPCLVSYNTILQIRRQRHVLSPDYHMTLKKAARSFISTSHWFLKGKLPNVSRNQIWVYTRCVHLFQGIYDWNLENNVFI